MGRRFQLADAVLRGSGALPIPHRDMRLSAQMSRAMLTLTPFLQNMNRIRGLSYTPPIASCPSPRIVLLVDWKTIVQTM
jgi:hypothetical protein